MQPLAHSAGNTLSPRGPIFSISYSFSVLPSKLAASLGFTHPNQFVETSALHKGSIGVGVPPAGAGRGGPLCSFSLSILQTGSFHNLMKEKSDEVQEGICTFLNNSGLKGKTHRGIHAIIHKLK